MLQGYQSALDALCALWSKDVPKGQQRLGLCDICQGVRTAVLGNSEGKVDDGLGCKVAGGNQSVQRVAVVEIDLRVCRNWARC